jgi:hypothetical protein
VNFRSESGEELPSLLFWLKGLARDLGKREDDQELVTKFVTSLDWRLAEQASSRAMIATKKPAGAYTLTEAYQAAVRAQTVNTRMKIARELIPRAAEASRPIWGGEVPDNECHGRCEPRVTAPGGERGWSLAGSSGAGGDRSQGGVLQLWGGRALPE